MDHGDNADEDWQKAEHIYNSSVRQLLFWINQPFLRLEKKIVEPIAAWADRADLFRLAERISPVIEAFGVIAIPMVLFFATQSYQESLQSQEMERLQQQAVKDYLEQLSTILLDAEGDLREPQNERLRTVTTAATLTLLREPNLDGERKGQIIKFLSQMELINSKDIYGPLRPEDKIPTLSLSQADLSNANLSDINLTFADLSYANMTNTSLAGANLSKANLQNADLENSTISIFVKTDPVVMIRLDPANLSGVNLSYANLSHANLTGTNLSGANLRFALLIHADFNGFTVGDTTVYSDTNVKGARFSRDRGTSEEQRQYLKSGGAIIP